MLRGSNHIKCLGEKGLRKGEMWCMFDPFACVYVCEVTNDMTLEARCAVLVVLVFSDMDAQLDGRPFVTCGVR